jgi:hypothetical protein
MNIRFALETPDFGKTFIENGLTTKKSVIMRASYAYHFVGNRVFRVVLRSRPWR